MNGQQGYVVCRKYKGKKIIVKTSKFIDYAIEGEFEALKLLKKLKSDHFTKLIKKNFKKKPKLFIKYVDGNSFSDYLRLPIEMKIEDVQMLINISYQTLAACAYMYLKLGITHNDLHTSNILVRETDCDVHVYKFEDQVFEFKTYGRMPVIIDFGYSYVPNRKLYPPIAFFDIGYFPHEPDQLVDARILLTRTAKTLKLKQTSPLVSPLIKAYFNKIYQLFKPLNLKRGWFRSCTFQNIEKYLKEICYANCSDKWLGILDKKYGEFDTVIGILISQIKLPLAKIESSEDDIKNLSAAYKKFAYAFTSIVTFRIPPYYRRNYLNRNYDKIYDRHIITPSLILIKNLFKLPLLGLVKRYKTISIDNLMLLQKLVFSCFTRVQIVLIPVLNDQGKLKRELYANSCVKSLIEVLNVMPKENIEYVPGIKVRVHDCVQSNHYTKTMTENDIKFINW
jgi:serine/threonine protein kinase